MKDFITRDKKGLLEWLDQKAEERRNRMPELPHSDSQCEYIKTIIHHENGQSICPMNFDFNAGLTESGHDPYGLNEKTMMRVRKCFLGYIKNPSRKVLESTFYLDKLDKAFKECDYWESEIVLKLMPEEMKARKDYVLCLDKFLTALYNAVVISQRSWQPCKAAVVEQMCCYHPAKEIRITGLEMLISNDIGSGCADNDLTFELCETSRCEWICTSYLNAQDAEGYRKIDPFCPVHGDKFYDKKEKRELFEKWKRLIESYV